MRAGQPSGSSRPPAARVWPRQAPGPLRQPQQRQQQPQRPRSLAPSPQRRQKAAPQLAQLRMHHGPPPLRRQNIRPLPGRLCLALLPRQAAQRRACVPAPAHTACLRSSLRTLAGEPRAQRLLLRPQPCRLRWRPCRRRRRRKAQVRRLLSRCRKTTSSMRSSQRRLRSRASLHPSSRQPAAPLPSPRQALLPAARPAPAAKRRTLRAPAPAWARARGRVRRSTKRRRRWPLPAQQRRYLWQGRLFRRRRLQALPLGLGSWMPRPRRHTAAARCTAARWAGLESCEVGWLAGIAGCLVRLMQRVAEVQPTWPLLSAFSAPASLLICA